MTEPTDIDALRADGGFAPCPTCRQYSHSIGDDALADAFMHFQTMIAHPVRGHPMGDVFDAKTRDAAQVLMAEARTAADLLDERAALLSELTRYREAGGDLCEPDEDERAGRWTDEFFDACMKAGVEWMAGKRGPINADAYTSLLTYARRKRDEVKSLAALDAERAAGKVRIAELEAELGSRNVD